ncbi:MAG: MaoC/PaaZ C-terminal domain-containing protein [Hyphomicrobiaceae bacterium]
MGRYFEDLAADVVRELGSHRFERDEMIAFSLKYDPQLFHLDDAAAANTIYGALTASGWHTAAVWLRHLIDDRNREGDYMRFCGERPARYGPSPGFEKLRWLKPVFIGDTISYTTKIIEKRDSKSRPAVGLTISYNEGKNQHGDVVFSIVSKMFVERRTPLERAG